jgi:hypothetical protein
VAGNGFGDDRPQDLRNFQPFRQIEPPCPQSREPRAQIEADELGERHREMREAVRVDGDALDRLGAGARRPRSRRQLAGD